MKKVAEKYQNLVIQIATPYSTGTGFYLSDYDLIVTNEHIVRDNKEVVINGEGWSRQVCPVVFMDPVYDLAFLRAPSKTDLPNIGLEKDIEVKKDDPIVAIGYPLGRDFITKEGLISNTTYERGGIQFLEHDAALNPGNSGGPLINPQGNLLGVNTFLIKDGKNIGFTLPVKYLLENLEKFQGAKKKIGVRCLNCESYVFKGENKNGRCPSCDQRLVLPSELEDYEPKGVSKTIEQLLVTIGHPIKLSRRGPNNWQIHQGSATINISYYEKTGLIIGDAYLCHLPKQDLQPLYEFLLKENDDIESLTFSIKENDIVLSLLIYDRYLNEETGMKLLKHLFQKADDVDNILVEKYGASWIIFDK